MSSPIRAGSRPRRCRSSSCRGGRRRPRRGSPARRLPGFNAAAPLTVLAGGQARVGEVAQGLALRAYAFDTYRTPEKDAPEPNRAVSFAVRDPAAAEAAFAPLGAQAEGVTFARDLVSEPANVLGTVEFASRLVGLKELGVEVEVLDEPELEALGMRTLLAVGQGSESPSKVVVMQWKGGGEEAPFALVGKGVVFDTGGISIKPGAGMEEMTMDMGGAAVVAGVMRTLALRKAPANVVGLVGLVENMPDGKAQRPGDVVRSMKGDTIEVINTDAEGRLVLADVLWYAQERFKPRAMVDLATLTGAIIVALGHEMAGVFSNDDKLAEAFLAAAAAEGEGAWRMPLAPAYDKLIKSRIADVANVGGRAGGVGDRGAVPAAFRQGRDALDASRHRRGRLCLEGRRARAEGGDRLGGAGAGSADPGPVPGLSRHGGGAVLPAHRLAARGEPAGAAGTLAGARLAGAPALRVRGGDGVARRAPLDLPRGRPSCRTAPPGPVMRRCSRST